MQTLPANGQAQPLPAKWVIKYTPQNAEGLNKWANDNIMSFSFYSNDGYFHHDTETGRTYISENIKVGYELIDDAQLLEIQNKRPLNEIIETTYNNLTAAGHSDLAAALKAKHPDIWPVDYAAVVLEKAVAWYEDLPVQNNQQDCELRYAVRNYLTNQK